MKLNELKPVDQVNIVVEVIEEKDERVYNLRLSNGVIVACFRSNEEVGNFFGELEFPNIPTSKL